MSERLLVVDDEEVILLAIPEYFSSIGYTVDCTRDLQEAKDLILERDYALVIADLRLTGTYGAEGLELFNHVRKHRPATRFVMLTAYGFLDIEREALRRGVDAFLHKPTALRDIAKLVRSLLDGRVIAGRLAEGQS